MIEIVGRIMMFHLTSFVLTCFSDGEIMLSLFVLFTYNCGKI